MSWLVRDGDVLAAVELADTARARRRGLLGRESFDGALVLRPCRHVHTARMQFPIDVAFCDAEGVVPRVARAAYHLLGRRTFLTTGETESRAWTFRAGAKAPECAGVIHSDLQRGFIRAEVIFWAELLDVGSWTKAKEQGKLRVEGKDYEVVDGDVLEIRFNV